MSVCRAQGGGRCRHCGLRMMAVSIELRHSLAVHSDLGLEESMIDFTRLSAKQHERNPLIVEEEGKYPQPMALAAPLPRPVGVSAHSLRHLFDNIVEDRICCISDTTTKRTNGLAVSTGILGRQAGGGWLGENIPCVSLGRTCPSLAPSKPRSSEREGQSGAAWHLPDCPLGISHGGTRWNLELGFCRYPRPAPRPAPHS